MLDVLALYERLNEQRLQISGLWREIERYCLPYKGVFDVKSPYSLQDDTIFRAINILVSGLYSYLTSPSAIWFRITSPGVKYSGWTAEATERLHALLLKSNFYKEIYNFYKDLVVYGVSCLYCEGRPVECFSFKTISPKNFVFRRNDFNEIDFVAVDMKMTVNEMDKKWGLKNLPEPFNKQKDKTKTYDIILAVYKDYGKDGEIVSEWREKETGKLLSKGRYDTFPFFIGQWDTASDSIYASSPVINTLPSVILVNRLVKTFWVNNEKLSNPPLDVPYEGYLGDLDISPGAINYRTTSDPNDRIQPIITSGNINITIEGIQEVRRSIQERMFVDLFLLMQDKTMTATEVIQRTQEKMLLLGSVIGRLLHDVFTPLVKRILGLAIGYGFVEEPTEEISGLEFLSPLAQAQKASEYNGIVMVLNTVLQIAQFNPEVTDVVDWDFVVKKVGKLYCVDERAFKDDEEIEATRQQRAQFQQMHLQLQMAEAQAKIKKTETQAQANIARAREKMGGLLPFGT